jgi:hypothetical protein
MILQRRSRLAALRRSKLPACQIGSVDAICYSTVMNRRSVESAVIILRFEACNPASVPSEGPDPADYGLCYYKFCKKIVTTNAIAPARMADTCNSNRPFANHCFLDVQDDFYCPIYS